MCAPFLVRNTIAYILDTLKAFFLIRLETVYASAIRDSVETDTSLSTMVMISGIGCKGMVLFRI